MRAPFLEALERYVAKGSENGSLIGLLLVDIGKMTQINHRFGYEEADL
jgi:GGDEF domain-containing protein